jgi:hypothetical protein
MHEFLDIFRHTVRAFDPSPSLFYEGRTPGSLKLSFSARSSHFELTFRLTRALARTAWMCVNAVVANVSRISRFV